MAAETSIPKADIFEKLNRTLLGEMVRVAPYAKEQPELSVQTWSDSRFLKTKDNLGDRHF